MVKVNTHRRTAVFLFGLTTRTLSGMRAGATSSDDLDISPPQKAHGMSFRSCVYMISGGGANIAGTRDQFHFNKAR